MKAEAGSIAAQEKSVWKSCLRTDILSRERILDEARRAVNNPQMLSKETLLGLIEMASKG